MSASPSPASDAATPPGRAVTLNVIFTPGTARRLLPLSLSLLQSPAGRVRLVANGSDPDEIELMRAASDRVEGVSHYVLPNRSVLELGDALNHLFESSRDPEFAWVDSDVVADGDFLPSLWPLGSGAAGAFAAPLVAGTRRNAMTTPRSSVLGSGQHWLPDGTFVGNTFCAIYDRSAVEAVWERAPRGFGIYHHYAVPKEVRAWLSARGWRFRTFDTARMLNLQLLLAGYELEDRHSAGVHHIGGLSYRHFSGSRGIMLRLQAIRRNPDGRLRHIADGIQTRFLYRFRSEPDAEHVRRRRIVRPYLDEVLDAVAAGRPAPPRPETGSIEVDRHLAQVVSALEAQYPRGLEALTPD